LQTRGFKTFVPEALDWQLKTAISLSQKDAANLLTSRNSDSKCAVACGKRLASNSNGRSGSSEMQHKKIEAVVLDVGHTLVYPSPQAVAQVLGFEVPTATFFQALGYAHSNAVRLALKASRREGHLVSEDARVFFANLVSRLCHEAQTGSPSAALHRALLDQGSSLWSGIFDDAQAFIDRCRKSGLAVAVLSNSDGGTNRLLQRCGLGPFDKVFDSSMIGLRKPARRAFEAAGEALGVDLCRCLFIGDSPITDGLGAHRAGMHSLLIRRYETERRHTFALVLGTPLSSVTTLDDVTL
jgi:HAD superfamily hydrolase (TIGR01509 family)